MFTVITHLTRPRFAMPLSLLLMASLAGGCKKEQETYDLRMWEQPKVEPYKHSTFFADGLSARPLVAGTVPRTERYFDRNSEPAWETESHGDGFPSDFPTSGEPLRQKLARGQERYEIFCSACHGYTGHGDGMIPQRGFTPPPSYHLLESDRVENPYRYQREVYLQTVPPRYFYNVISDGFGAMYGYGDRIPPDDRWAIVAYVKLLQQAQPEMTGPPPPGATDPAGQTIKPQP